MVCIFTLALGSCSSECANQPLELEYCTIHEPVKADIHASDLYIRHLKDNKITLVPNQPLSIALKFMIKELIANFPDTPAFGDRLCTILGQVNAGYSWTIRQLELDLIQAGKVRIFPLFISRREL